MSEVSTQLIVKVFLASPGGLEIEREVARRVVDEINRDNAEQWRLSLKLVGWEETVGGNRRAQSEINHDLDGCQYFIGMIWDHWGSVPYGPEDQPGPYSSGFEEEFERASERFNKGDMRDVLLLLKEIPQDKLNDPGESLKKVLAFIKKINEQRKPLYKKFGDTSEFDTLIRQRLMKIGWDVHNQNRSLSHENTAVASLPDAGQSKSPANDGERLFQPEAVEFLEALIAKTNNYDDLTDLEVARARLLSKGLRRSSNDRETLGVHDSNLIYQNHEILSLSGREIRHLVATGIDYFDHQLVPLWHWLSQLDDRRAGDDQVESVNSLLIWSSLVGEAKSKTNALRILRELRIDDIEIDDFFDRSRIIEKWLAPAISDGEFNAACEYLAEFGQVDDITLLDSLKPPSAERRRDTLDCVVIEIELSQNGQRAGWEMLLNRNPGDLSSGLARRLEQGVTALETEFLLSTLGVNDNECLLFLVKELCHRKALSADIAKELLEHDNYEIRYLAVTSLQNDERLPSDEQIKNLLSRPSKRSSGLLSVFDPFGASSDLSWWKKLLRDRMSALPRKTLIELAYKMTPDRNDYIEVLFEKFGKSCLNEMRAHLEDRFERRFNEYRTFLSSAFPNSEDLLKKYDDLREHSIKSLMISTLNSFCLVANDTDLVLVRELIDEGNCELSAAIIIFLGRFGEWEDVERLLKLHRQTARPQFFMIESDQPVAELGRSLHQLGRLRLPDLLAKIDDHHLATAVLGALTQLEVKALNDDWLLDQLGVEDDRYRKVLCLRLCGAMPKMRLKTLLRRYLERRHFYNAVHWLDMGISLPAPRARALGKAELATALS